MTLLSIDQILAADDREVREVDVPEWGGTVRLMALSGAGRDAWEASLRVVRGSEIAADTENVRAKLVGRCIVNETGERMFTDSQISQLGDKSALVLDRLFDIVSEMSGLGDKAVQDAEENSEAAPSGGSTSASPETTDEPPASS